MTANSFSSVPNKGHPLGSAVTLSKLHHILLIARRAGATMLAKIKAGLGALQMARMMTVLSEMNDVQLAQIGISRADIPRYAKSLMAQDGSEV